ncbi:ATP-dependent RNA helicase-like protein A [Patellaria atrata CBS 101060]|uniref:ATP-dependent RNA helicase-like protein A n=1 Tax=Patellaria atrata CBS 101060 TaxID=1346257 RepID=A0A9P4S8M4_9PEZI|nr:ATP-dependent RNA helicase-like protein A [Patellaria atrata CBS 101060]
MPKNPHPPRGDGKKKLAANSNFKEDDASYIVFSNAKGDPKKAKSSNTQQNAASGKGKAKEATPSTEDGPKKPTVREVIGGASWTGKLPVNLLSEHCQKQKWDKPEYTMRNIRGQFSSGVILKNTNPKTKEMTTLPVILLPPDDKKHGQLALQPSAVEARHFAAVYTLFRVCSMKNIHMMLPPNYRDLWKGPFKEMKDEAVANGNAWMYDADPFQARKERDEAVRLKAQARESSEKRTTPDSTERTPGVNGESNRAKHVKPWTGVPKVEMGKRVRAEVQHLVSRDAVWNAHNHRMTPTESKRVVDEIVNLGFRRAHVDEAAEICKDREEVLHWLLVHIPEDDLPAWCLPEGYSTGITMASGNLRRDGIVTRLAAAGYAVEVCEEALDLHEDNESKAATYLQDLLLGLKDGTYDSNLNTCTPLEQDTILDEPDVWAEEQEVLVSIYGDKVTLTSSEICRIKLDTNNQNITGLIELQVRRPSGPYPYVLPIISIHGKLPTYIRLSITKQALKHAQSALLGQQIIFNIVDWLENEISNIIDRPGRLRDVAAVSSLPDSEYRVRESTTTGKQLPPKPVTWVKGSEKSKRILAEWDNRQTTSRQQKMLKARESLPAWALQNDIVNVINNNQVIIISGETGSGKSTQSVQFILDSLIKRELGDCANIICTQPRRISAIGLADRVADERCSTVGQEIGYAIRGESKRSHETKIMFVTTGVLLRQLQTSGAGTDDVAASLANVSHVVIDEVHERSLDVDFLLVLLRDVLRKRRDLRLILMSATLDANIYEKYFIKSATVGKVEIPGRTHLVTDYYLDDIVRMTMFDGPNDEEQEGIDTQLDISGALRRVGMRINYDLIADVVRHIDQELGAAAGGILIFLPGTMEINRTLQALRSIPNLHALPLHASLLPGEQRRVFSSPPAGKRKVVAATNVAETSITIEDIVAVIDTGRVKETSFDPVTNMVKLQETWASRAACKQRRGRAGRVRAGKCYKLYTRNAETSHMVERPDPEIKRVPLEQLCLSVKAMGIQDIAAFLAGALTPPDELAVEGSLKILTSMGAIDGDQLTGLGHHLAMIPADLRCGKLLIYGAIFGSLEACLTIAAILTVRSPFLSPQGKRDAANAVRTSFSKGQGDLIADLRAYEQWSDLRSKGSFRCELRQWCDENFLSPQTLQDISSNRSQYLSSLKDAAFLPLNYSSTNNSFYGSYNRHNGNGTLLRALIAGSFHPQIARIQFPETKYLASVSGTVAQDPEARQIKYFTRDSGRVFIHPSSTLFSAQTYPNNSAFVSYFSKIATSKVFVRDLTPFNAYSLLLFCGGVQLDTMGRGLLVDGWVRLRGWARIGVLVSRLRMMLDEVLARKLEDPGSEFGGGEIVDVVRRLVELDGMDR